MIFVCQTYFRIHRLQTTLITQQWMKVLEGCLSDNCSAACNHNNSEMWECCNCSLGIPPSGEPLQSVTVSDFY